MDVQINNSYLTIVTFLKQILFSIGMVKDLEQQLELISDIKKFCIEGLGMIPNPSFTKITDQKYYCGLYACPKDAIKTALPDGQTHHVYDNFTDRNSEASELIKKGLDIYKVRWEGVGSEDSQITRSLLKATKIRKTYLIIHENVHIHVEKIGLRKNIILPIEEAIADQVAYQGALIFYKENKLMQSFTEKRKRHDEEFYAWCMKYTQNLSEAYEKYPFLGQKILSQAKIEYDEKYRKKNNRKEVNNALFYRESFYARYQKDVKEILSDKDPKEYLRIISGANSRIHSMEDLRRLF